jgi:hypothetical protein
VKIELTRCEGEEIKITNNFKKETVAPAQISRKVMDENEWNTILKIHGLTRPFHSILIMVGR